MDSDSQDFAREPYRASKDTGCFLIMFGLFLLSVFVLGLAAYSFFEQNATQESASPDLQGDGIPNEEPAFPDSRSPTPTLPAEQPNQTPEAPAVERPSPPPTLPVISTPKRKMNTPPLPPIPTDASMHTLNQQLEQSYQNKLANPEFVKWKNKPGIPNTFQTFAEERRIKQVRAEIARKASPPPGAKVLTIPLHTATSPAVDGVIRPDEWASAATINIPGEKSRLLLTASASTLFVACDVPDEKTEKGFDQFRFYIHIDASPLLVNERIHLGRYNRPRKLRGIRQTRFRWKGEVPTSSEERWKKYDLSDWCIYDHAVGASTLNPHRQYEAALNLKEIGLHLGIPFPAFVEIETDPTYEGKKFKRRNYLGHLGSQKKPVWFVIQPN